VESPTDSRISPLAPPNAKRVRVSVFSGAGTGQSIELRRAVSLVGSRPGCKITLRQSDIAPVQCAIVNTGDEVYLRDLVSPEGTFLNGLPAECEKLSDGDIIRVGKWELAVEIHAPALGDPTGSSVINLEPAPTVVAFKTLNNGPMMKMQRDVAVIGRKAGADVVLQDKQASRAHALVFLLNGQAVVCDLLSENGLMINEEATRFGVLHSGDTLTIGASKLRVIIPSPTIQVPSSRNGSQAGTGDTVVKAQSDQSDLIDIRAAEIDRR
jgi:pSer/pThr/pTyr-binding forkhead associated (FHA) protein